MVTGSSIEGRYEKQSRVMIVLDTAAQICGSAGCLVAQQKGALYCDKHHIMDFAAQRFTPLFQGMIPHYIVVLSSKAI